TAGYDTATGLGSPKASAVVDLLSASSSSGSNGNTGSNGGSNSDGSSGSSNPQPPQLPASPIDGVFVSSFPTSPPAGTDGTVRIKLTNPPSSPFSGPLKFDLYASPTATATASDTLLTSSTLASVTLRAGASKIIKLKFTYSNSLGGDYYITAAVTA